VGSHWQWKVTIEWDSAERIYLARIWERDVGVQVDAPWHLVGIGHTREYKGMELGRRALRLSLKSVSLVK
jgi:lysozyme family protein